MGMIYADLELVNYADEALMEGGYLPSEKVRNMPVTVLVDSGAFRLTINETMRNRLGLRVRQNETTELADGTLISLPVAGPVTVKFKERACITFAHVLPGNEEALLGAMPMEEMNLMILPKENRIDYNPKPYRI